MLQSLNHEIFLYINAAPGTPAWLIDTMLFVANDLVYFVPLLLVALWLVGDTAQRSAALRAFAVAILGLAVNQAIGMLWPQPRPFAIGLGHTWSMHVADASFPSDHLTLFAAIGWSLLLDRRLVVGAATLATGLVVGWARIYVGLHFPLDMVGSLLVAGASCAVVVPIWSRAGRTLTNLLERLYRRLLAGPIGWGVLRP